MKSSGKWKLSGGSSSSGSDTTRSSNDSSVRGSTSSERWRSSGPPQASSGCRSTSQACRSEYVSTKWRSSCTWKPWSTAWSFRSATNPAMSMAATAPSLPRPTGTAQTRSRAGRTMRPCCPAAPGSSRRRQRSSSWPGWSWSSRTAMVRTRRVSTRRSRTPRRRPVTGRPPRRDRRRRPRRPPSSSTSSPASSSTTRRGPRHDRARHLRRAAHDERAPPPADPFATARIRLTRVVSLDYPIAMAVRPSDGSVWVARKGGAVCRLSRRFVHGEPGGGERELRATSRGCSASPSTRRGAASTPATRTPRGTPASTSSRCEPMAPPTSPNVATSSPRTSPRRTTTAATSGSGRMAVSTWASATGAARETPTATRRTRAPTWARSCASTLPGRPSNAGSAGSGTPGGSASTGPTATCGSLTSGRGAGRRSPACRPAPSRAATWAGAATRAPTPTAGCAPAGGHTGPLFEYPHGPGCSITGGYVYRGSKIPALVGAYLYSDYCDGQIRGLTLQGGRVRTHRGLGVEPRQRGVVRSGRQRRPLRADPRRDLSHRSRLTSGRRRAARRAPRRRHRRARGARRARRTGERPAPGPGSTAATWPPTRRRSPCSIGPASG